MPTVLLVDDNEELLETYAIWLDRLESVSVRTATDGGEALDRLDRTVDVAVLDRQMPRTAGREVCRAIRSTCPDCAIIVVSAFEPDGAIADGDYDRYLTKPVGGDALIGAIERESGAALTTGG